MKSRFNFFFPAVLCLVFLAPVDPGLAQEEGAEQQKTKRVEALSEKVHRRLSKAQEALEADDFVTTEALLRQITELRGLTPYELAQTNRFYGFLYLRQEDDANAIKAFLRIIETNGPDVIGAGTYNETIWTLAQLYIRVENYPEAVNYSRRWLNSQENPAPGQYMILAMAHFQLDQWREALEVLMVAIDKAKATGVEIEENWWRYVLAAHWELEQFPEALEITKIQVAQWPKKNYWNQLQGLYGIVDDEQRQLAAYWCMHDQGLLETNSELVGMARLFMLAENPYKAGVLLQDGLDNGLIEEKTSTYRLLAQAWQLAREDRKAVDPLRKAAESEEDAEEKGILYLRLAETHNALGDYDECAAAARTALSEGELKIEGRAYVSLGQCLFEQEKFDEASDAFTRAIRDSETRRTATSWRNHLNNEVKRLQELERKLAEASK